MNAFTSGHWSKYTADRIGINYLPHSFSLSLSLSHSLSLSLSLSPQFLNLCNYFVSLSLLCSFQSSPLSSTHALGICTCLLKDLWKCPFVWTGILSIIFSRTKWLKTMMKPDIKTEESSKLGHTVSFNWRAHTKKSNILDF